MKDYKTISREKVDADPGAARYMSETHLDVYKRQRDERLA